VTREVWDFANLNSETVKAITVLEERIKMETGEEVVLKQPSLFLNAKKDGYSPPSSLQEINSVLFSSLPASSNFVRFRL